MRLVKGTEVKRNKGVGSAKCSPYLALNARHHAADFRRWDFGRLQRHHRGRSAGKAWSLGQLPGNESDRFRNDLAAGVAPDSVKLLGVRAQAFLKRGANRSAIAEARRRWTSPCRGRSGLGYG
jgi:hypothetical protein